MFVSPCAPLVTTAGVSYMPPRRPLLGRSPRKCSMSRKKLSTTIYVTPEQNEQLRLLHDRTKVPVAVYIREGIDLVLRQYAHLLPGQLTLTREPASARDTGRDIPAAEPTTPLLPTAPERAARASKG